jgi:hypothetical protein
MIPLDRPRLGHSSLWVFISIYFDLDILNGVQNSIALHAQMYLPLITNSFGQTQGGSYADFF